MTYTVEGHFSEEPENSVHNGENEIYYKRIDKYPFRMRLCVVQRSNGFVLFFGKGDMIDGLIGDGSGEELVGTVGKRCIGTVGEDSIAEVFVKKTKGFQQNQTVISLWRREPFCGIAALLLDVKKLV